MNASAFLGMITKSNDVIKEEAKSEENKKSHLPGIKVIAVVQAFIEAVLWLAAWALVGLLAAAGPALGEAGQWFIPWLDKFFSFSPFARLLDYSKALAVAVLAMFLYAAVVDFLARKMFKVQGGKQTLFFNVASLALAPYYAFMVVPVVGWFIMLIGMFINLLRCLRHLYGLAGLRTLALILLANLATAAVVVLASAGLDKGLAGLYDLDPLGEAAWRVKERVVESLGGGPRE